MQDLKEPTSREKHQAVLCKYVLKPSSIHKNDFSIIKENHQFIWDENLSETELTWRKQLAKKYYDKLFKEYCVCDLTKYKENKIALRWRTNKEVFIGKGQFICAEKLCSVQNLLRTWEVNFGYIEAGIKKNALVKIKLCKTCSSKLNYRHKKKELKREKKYKSLFSDDQTDKDSKLSKTNKDISNSNQTKETELERTDKHQDATVNLQLDRELEFEKYLIDLL
ncbi:protein FRA10AC1 [Condylostylus longicornis]|uniref:protein FRA10AC1 n=1 Tax=Condylostylus longicornis TaxID=2530218 RepID=UPI00244E1DF4|nr:protein FRA10AC1 [Condylostylus longicornis]